MWVTEMLGGKAVVALVNSAIAEAGVGSALVGFSEPAAGDNDAIKAGQQTSRFHDSNYR